MPMRKAAGFAADGCVIKPLVQLFVQNEKIEFDFHLRAEWIRERAWDGWFHASTHPSLREEELIAYLEQRAEPWKPNYVSAMSTIFGTLVHVVVQRTIDYYKIGLPFPPGPCIACGLPRTGKKSCHEHGAVNIETHSRGHMDDIVTVGPGALNVLDIKTIKPWGAYGLKEAPDMDLEYFRSTWGKYYAQLQDYMRMTGIRNSICFFMAMGNPWEMREYHVPFDPAYALDIETRYKKALLWAAR